MSSRPARPLSSHKPRILVVSRKEVDDEKRRREKVRFGRMVDALNRGGLSAEHTTPSDMGALCAELANVEPDIIFSSFFRFSGSDQAEGYLYEAALERSIAWIGSHPGTMDVALSKSRTKAHWRMFGIPTPDWFIVRKFQDGTIDGLEHIDRIKGFPFIVKPANEGNSRGIDDAAVVNTPIELDARARMVVEQYGEAIVEQFVSGQDGSREFTVAMIGNGANALIEPVEIRKPASLVISEADKELQTTKLLPVEDAKLKDRIVRLAQKIFMSACARDYSRCDILLHEDKLYAIEINGQPMVPDRWFEACARGAGLDEIQYINAIALAGIVSNAGIGHAFVPIPQDMVDLLPSHVVDRLKR
jgi:D-alanine-D-alanine ligase